MFFPSFPRLLCDSGVFPTALLTQTSTKENKWKKLEFHIEMEAVEAFLK